MITATRASVTEQLRGKVTYLVSSIIALGAAIDYLRGNLSYDGYEVITVICIFAALARARSR